MICHTYHYIKKWYRVDFDPLINEYYQTESSPNSFGILVWLRDESEAPPTGSITQTYIWDQEAHVTNSWNGQYLQVEAGVDLNVDYFLRQPNMTQDGWGYTPYPYPHPLVGA